MIHRTNVLSLLARLRFGRDFRIVGQMSIEHVSYMTSGKQNLKYGNYMLLCQEPDMRPHATYASIFACIVCLAGCAVQRQSGDRVVVGIDQAGLFGKEVDTFVLPDGGKASIRELEHRLSLKFQAYSRVVEIERATAVQFRSAQEIDGYTLVVLDKSEKNCAVKTHLMAIKGGEVRQWDFGDCRSAPEVALAADGMRFDLRSGTRTTRYLFSQGRLLYGDLLVARQPATVVGPATGALPGAGASPVLSATTAPGIARATPERQAAASDNVAASGSGAAPRAPSASGHKPANARDVLPASVLTFSAKEQAPRTIHLTY
jgi:hypothetical protein